MSIYPGQQGWQSENSIRKGSRGCTEKQVPKVEAAMGVWRHVSQENLFYFCLKFGGGA